MPVAVVRLTPSAVALLTLWTATACGDGPGEPIGPPTAAVATRQCGPADGPAVGITFAPSLEAAQVQRPPYVGVAVWQSPSALAGRTWVLTGGRDGTAFRQLTAGGAFETATYAAVRVQRVATDTTIEGTVDLVFRGGVRVRQPFRAAWRPNVYRLFCG